MAATLLNFPAAQSPSVEGEDDGDYLSIEKLRKQVLDYYGSKSAEIEEQKEARRYDAGSQWTEEEIAVLKKRKQPVVTFNLIAPKNNAVVGLVERLRQDPKCFPRTPKEQAGADLGTAVLRFGLDENDWKGKHPRIARQAAVNGVAGVEYDIERGDVGDPDVRMHIVYADTFFYDPRSYDEGFTDARFMGTSKWIDVDHAKEIAPGHDEEIDSLIETGTDLTSNSDREVHWVNSTSKRVRMVDHWYIVKGEWRWALYINNTILMQGLSPYRDERNKTFPRYRMFSAGVDQDGDRFSFHRQWKSGQDEYNHRRSKALHLMNSRRVRATKGMVDDVEVARREEARADGWVELNPLPDGKYITDDQRAMADMRAHLELMNSSREMIDNFGPNLALLGEGLQDSSGRAINLLQQAGMSQLGPYLSAFKNWKIRVYRDLWNIIKTTWKAERWIRVTDDDQLVQWFQINQLGTDEFGRPAIINAIGSLDVDIILDEGPDTINMQADAAATLQALGQQFTGMFPELAIELSSLDNRTKKKALDIIEKQKSTPPPPDPKVAAAQQLMQIKQQEMQADLQLQAQKQAADLQFQQQQAASQAEQQRQQSAMDFELESAKAAAQMQLERDKADHQMQIEGAKANHAMSIQREQHGAKMQMDREAADQTIQHEDETHLAKTGEGPTVKALTEVVGEFKEAVAGMKEAVAAPRKVSLIRDNQGRPSGAETHALN